MCWQFSLRWHDDAEPVPGAGTGHRLFDGDPALAGTYDEMFELGGAARAPFARIAALLAKLAPAELARAQALAETALLHRA